MVNSRISLLLLLFILIPLFLAAETPDFTLRLYNEQVYFTDSKVEIQLSLKNNTSQIQRFHLADNRVFSFSFEVRDSANRRVTSADDFTIARLSNQVFYRTVTLEPGEELSLIEELTDYVMFEHSGTYVVSGHFYPELYHENGSLQVGSNQITLSIRPGYSDQTREEQTFQAVVERQLQRRQLSPDEVVTYLLQARQQNNWDQFFLYLNLEQLYRQDDARDRSFRQLSEERQLEILSQFKNDLMGAGVDPSLVLIPDTFEIVETRYSPTQGTVVAELQFIYEQYREVKRYTYNLERRNGFWEIISYNVVNLANEAR